MKTLFRSLSVILIAATISNAQILPLPPVLLAPVNNAVNISLTPSLKWNILILIGSLSSYRLQVSTTQNFSTIVLDSSGIISDSLKIPQGKLSPGSQFYWRVNAAILLNTILLTTPYSAAFRFTTGTFTGIAPAGQEIPFQYKLYNNYPNPFNPVTKIQFDNITSQQVILSVYDVLGNKIEELVNEDLEAGHYEVEWKANGCSSGIYFYRINTGSFSDTKKMVLAK